MKVIEILGEDREPAYTKIVEGCRGILVNDGKILLCYYQQEDQYLIPGGGLEDGETLVECCIRELAEETGMVISPTRHYLTLEEYYHEYYFKSHYFICKAIGECQASLTEAEKQNGLVPIWVDFDKAIETFAAYGKYKDTNEMRYGAYYREYIALLEYTKYM